MVVVGIGIWLPATESRWALSVVGNTTHLLSYWLGLGSLEFQACWGNCLGGVES